MKLLFKLLAAPLDCAQSRHPVEYEATTEKVTEKNTH